MNFQLLSTIKGNLGAKIMQNAYLCVIFHVKHKKLPFLVVLTWFLILGKIKDGHTINWWRHRPPAAPLSLKFKKIKGFPLKVKSFQNTVTYQKLWGRVPSTQPPLPTLYHAKGMNLRNSLVRKPIFLTINSNLSTGITNWSGVAPGFFPCWGIAGNMCNIGATAPRHEKLGGSGGMLPLGNFENLSCLGGKHQDFIVVNIVRQTWWPFLS